MDLEHARGFAILATRYNNDVYTGAYPDERFRVALLLTPGPDAMVQQTLLHCVVQIGTSDGG